MLFKSVKFICLNLLIFGVNLQLHFPNILTLLTKYVNVMIYAKINYIDRKSQAYVKPFKKRSTCDRSLNKKKKEKSNASMIMSRKFSEQEYENSTSQVRIISGPCGILRESASRDVQEVHCTSSASTLQSQGDLLR